MDNVAELYAKLAEPFKPTELEWRGEPRGVDVRNMKSGDECKVLVFTYVQARAIQNRLDAMMGMDNWYDKYEPGPAGGVVCSLSLFINGRWITKQGIAANTQIEAEKGGESEALKRAAYKWGIGRYLYEMPESWCKAVVKGKGVVLVERPSLPEWAYPFDWKGDKEQPNTVITLPKIKEVMAQAYSQTPTQMQQAKAEVERQQAEEKINQAKGYAVPMGHNLPSEGKTYREILEASQVVGLQTLKLIAGRAEGIKPFEAKTHEEKAARSAAIYLLDHVGSDAKA
jgi:hypothetical protein